MKEWDPCASTFTELLIHFLIWERISVKHCQGHYGVKEVLFEASSALAFLLSFIIRTGTLNHLRYIAKLSHHIIIYAGSSAERAFRSRNNSLLSLIRKRSPFEPRTSHQHLFPFATSSSPLPTTSTQPHYCLFIQTITIARMGRRKIEIKAIKDDRNRSV